MSSARSLNGQWIDFPLIPPQQEEQGQEGKEIGASKNDAHIIEEYYSRYYCSICSSNNLAFLVLYNVDKWTSLKGARSRRIASPLLPPMSRSLSRSLALRRIQNAPVIPSMWLGGGAAVESEMKVTHEAPSREAAEAMSPSSESTTPGKKVEETLIESGDRRK